MYGGDGGAFAPFKTASGEENLPTVVFVGTALSFSDQIIRVAKVEFDGIAFERCDSLQDLKSGYGNFDNVVAWIVDESQAERLPDLVRMTIASAAETLTCAQVVLGYRDTEKAVSTFRALYARGKQCAVSYLPMNQQFDIWLSIMRLLLCGGKYIPEEVLERLPADMSAHKRVAPDETDLSDLTEREKEVLALVSEGKPNKTIASELDLSEHTIKLHIHHVITKLGVRNRTEAAIMFLGGGGDGAATC